MSKLLPHVIWLVAAGLLVGVTAVNGLLPCALVVAAVIATAGLLAFATPTRP
jgi:hypothetical protein